MNPEHRFSIQQDKQQNNSSVLPLDQVKQALEFGGFTPDDFAVFEVPGIAERREMLRERIRPKLEHICKAMTSRLPEALGEPIHPHIARHLRRAVNAAEETWIAFSRSPRAYRPFVYLRTAISANKVRITVVVEKDAGDKALFAQNLEHSSQTLGLYLMHHPTIFAYELRGLDGEPLRGHDLTGDALCAFARRLNRVKGQHAVFGIAFAKTHPVVQSGPEFLDAILGAARTLRPLYDCGKPGFAYTYTPEVIKGV